MEKETESEAETHIDIKPPPPPIFADVKPLKNHPTQEHPPILLSFFSSGSSRRRRRRGDTWVVSVFVILHAVAFAATMFVNDCWHNSNEDCAVSALGRFSFQHFSENPLLGPSDSTLDEVGALRRKFLTENHQTWRLFAFPCLHAGLIHLIINLGSVVFIGIHLEMEFGPFRVGIIYVLSAFAGTLVAALFVQNRPVVGSSGPLYGLIGAAISELIWNWRMYTDKFAALGSLFVVFTINLVLGFLPYVNNFASIGGFIAGILLGSVLLFSHQISQVPQNKGALFEYSVKSSIKSKLRQKIHWSALRSVTLILFCLLFAGCLVAFLRGIDMNKYCNWCQYVDCVPTEGWRCDDRVTSCEAMVSNAELTLTCMSNGNFRVFPFTNVSDARMNDLCNVIC
ncbi:hypothetical protein TIFTF001_014442 [Ficus carica]|uniref:RHOMBOID-like protein n=1 Tax=Ficus carica TaxID=3494 RepID=A0AA88A3W6_FICCA|nr:hypothetical protein TIFTF001_014442 [Ficus carica]